MPVLRRARRGTGEAARLISRGGGESASASASASSESGRHVKSKGRKRTLSGWPLVAALRHASRHARCSPSRYAATACAHSSGDPDELKSRAYHWQTRGSATVVAPRLAHTCTLSRTKAHAAACSCASSLARSKTCARVRLRVRARVRVRVRVPYAFSYE